MRHLIFLPLMASGFAMLSACGESRQQNVSRAVDSVLEIDQQNLSEIMLTSGNPEEAVTYFSGRIEQNPDDLAALRGLGKSLIRTGQLSEAVAIWRRVHDHPDATNDDKVMLADAHIRNNNWSEAETTLNNIPPTHESFERYRLEAMVADSKEQWSRADHFYEIAAGLTTRPSSVYNNWGYSKLTRGAPRDAEPLFAQALRHDPTQFTAKNNMALARAAQGNYRLPMVQMTQTERATLLHTMAIAAIRKGDVAIGRTLLHDAIETHPQHYEEAVRALRALEGNVTRG